MFEWIPRRLAHADAGVLLRQQLLARVDLLTGQWTEADALLREGVGLCEAKGYELFAWPGRYFLALLAALRDLDRAETIADSTVQWALPRRVRAALEYAAHARTLVALGRGSTANGCAARVRPWMRVRHLKIAEDAFVRMGARPWAARAGAELRATGEVKPRTRNAAVEALTPRSWRSRSSRRQASPTSRSARSSSSRTAR